MADCSHRTAMGIEVEKRDKASVDFVQPGGTTGAVDATCGLVVQRRGTMTSSFSHRHGRLVVGCALLLALGAATVCYDDTAEVSAIAADQLDLTLGSSTLTDAGLWTVVARSFHDSSVTLQLFGGQTYGVEVVELLCVVPGAKLAVGRYPLDQACAGDGGIHVVPTGFSGVDAGAGAAAWFPMPAGTLEVLQSDPGLFTGPGKVGFRINVPQTGLAADGGEPVTLTVQNLEVTATFAVPTCPGGCDCGTRVSPGSAPGGG